MELYRHQTELSEQGAEILADKKILYLAGEVRTGKTLISLQIAHLLSCTKVLFLTKKKAILSVQKDYKSLNPCYFLQVINYESIHKVFINPDLIILDEAHGLGAFPKPSKRTKLVKEKAKNLPIIYLSGTPSPESYSQLFHQFFVSTFSPWSEYRNFYKWANDGYVRVFKRIINSMPINDYTRANKQKIEEDIKPYLLTITQEQAGFTSLVKEKFLEVPFTPKQAQIYKNIKDKGIHSEGQLAAVASNGGHLINLLAQVSSGTVIYKDLEGNEYPTTIAITKAHFIQMTFSDNKIAVIYKYVQEFEVLKQFFPKFTTSPEEFNEADNLTFLGQVQSTREGVDLSSADAVVMYNIDFSATSYFQIRARMQKKTRTKEALLFWVFSDIGVEQKIYKAVSNKKNFTHSYYKKEEKKPKVQPQQKAVQMDIDNLLNIL